MATLVAEPSRHEARAAGVDASSASCPSRPCTRTLTRWAVALVAVGVAWRVLRYWLRFPLWGDEAFVCLNFLDRDYLSLTEPLRYHQLVPVLFLWSELTAYRLLGGTELAVRLLPCLAGLGSLALFWRLARLSVGPRAAVLAVGTLAVAYYPVRHSCEVKPYAFDLLMALALMVPAVAWLRRPERLAPLAFLAAFVPLALTASYPAVFVAGAVSIALLPTAWRQPGWKTRSLYAVYNLLVLATFLGSYWLVGRHQLLAYGKEGQEYWALSFPPAQPWALIRWLLSTHTGNMLAYPVGANDWASTPTFLLVVAGGYRLWRSRQRQLLLVFLAPFVLTFIAAAMHRYPYGGSARIAQHLAPAICLLAGTGTAALLEWLAHAPATLHRLTAGCCGILALIGAGGIAHDVMKPYKTEGDSRVRRLVAEIAGQATADHQIVVLDQPCKIGSTFEWYLRQQGDRVVWAGRVDWHRLRTSTSQLWCLRFYADPTEAARFADRLAKTNPGLVLADHASHTFPLGWSKDNEEHCEVFRWVRRPASPSSAR